MPFASGLGWLQRGIHGVWRLAQVAGRLPRVPHPSTRALRVVQPTSAITDSLGCWGGHQAGFFPGLIWCTDAPDKAVTTSIAVFSAQGGYVREGVVQI
jgi:hypothetical protein|mmetsp:Transcript_81516/g.136413  ORF Transcript_81516/g.136413 Transcript_81516/m.136413 type:complete len:98 (+) Transcript_81516:860-1153(+)